MSKRKSWHEVWMDVAKVISERSYDPRMKVGTVIVSEDNTRMLSMGYNGNYSGGPHCHESDIPGESGFIHSEVNALVKCDYNFHKKKIMYVTHSPCRACSKLIVNADISKVIYLHEYRETSGLDILRNSGVDVVRFSDIVSEQ